MALDFSKTATQQPLAAAAQEPKTRLKLWNSLTLLLTDRR